jgi:hypothetical protein
MRHADRPEDPQWLGTSPLAQMIAGRLRPPAALDDAHINPICLTRTVNRRDRREVHNGGSRVLVFFRIVAECDARS